MNSFDQLANYTNIQVSLTTLIIDILLAATCALVLKFFYIKFGQALSNRQRLAGNFVMIAITTALVIAIVKSSLALSLGLVGALSIVRFRTAVKEPEELAYLFLSIALGLGFGANQRLITLVSFGVILLIILFQNFFRTKISQAGGVYLSLTIPKAKKTSLNEVIELIKNHSLRIDLRKASFDDEKLTVVCNIGFKSFEEIDNLIIKLKKKYSSAQISITDTSGLLG